MAVHGSLGGCVEGAACPAGACSRRARAAAPWPRDMHPWRSSPRPRRLPFRAALATGTAAAATRCCSTRWPSWPPPTAQVGALARARLPWLPPLASHGALCWKHATRAAFGRLAAHPAVLHALHNAPRSVRSPPGGRPHAATLPISHTCCPAGPHTPPRSLCGRQLQPPAQGAAARRQQHPHAGGQWRRGLRRRQGHHGAAVGARWPRSGAQR